MTEQQLTIQHFSELVGRTPNTVRAWERLGLLTPSRDSAGRRLFTTADVEQAKAIAKERLAARGSGLRRAAA